MSEGGSRRRIAVTGVGLVSPLGRTAEDIWRRWAAGENAAAPITKFDVTNLHVKHGAEVPDFNPRQEVGSGKLARLLRPGEDFGYVAARSALADAGLGGEPLDSPRSGMAIGCRKEGPRVENLFHSIEVSVDEQGAIDRKRFVEEGIKYIPPQTIVEGLPNACMYYIGHEYHLQGVNHNLLALGSGATMALGEAARTIRHDEADLMLAGGYDSWINWLYLGQLSNRHLLSMRSENPQDVHRPFDRDRDGSIGGEGAGLFILEEWNRAHSRGARIAGELLGYAAATGVADTQLRENVRRLAGCIRKALADAGCDPAEIDAIHMTGDATRMGDAVEALAVKEVLGESTPLTTCKSATGHLGNASGGVELAVVLESMQRGCLPAIVNLDQPDTELPGDFVRERRDGLSLQRVLLLSRGWPAHYTAIVVQQPPN